MKKFIWKIFFIIFLFVICDIVVSQEKYSEEDFDFTFDLKFSNWMNYGLKNLEEEKRIDGFSKLISYRLIWKGKNKDDGKKLTIRIENKNPIITNNYDYYDIPSIKINVLFLGVGSAINFVDYVKLKKDDEPSVRNIFFKLAKNGKLTFQKGNEKDLQWVVVKVLKNENIKTREKIKKYGRIHSRFLFVLWNKAAVPDLPTYITNTNYKEYYSETPLIPDSESKLEQRPTDIAFDIDIEINERFYNKNNRPKYGLMELKEHHSWIPFRFIKEYRLIGQTKNKGKPIPLSKSKNKDYSATLTEKSKDNIKVNIGFIGVQPVEKEILIPSNDYDEKKNMEQLFKLMADHNKLEYDPEDSKYNLKLITILMDKKNVNKELIKKFKDNKIPRHKYFFILSTKPFSVIKDIIADKDEIKEVVLFKKVDKPITRKATPKKVNKYYIESLKKISILNKIPKDSLLKYLKLSLKISPEKNISELNCISRDGKILIGWRAKSNNKFSIVIKESKYFTYKFETNKLIFEKKDFNQNNKEYKKFINLTIDYVKKYINYSFVDKSNQQFSSILDSLREVYGPKLVVISENSKSGKKDTLKSVIQKDYKLAIPKYYLENKDIKISIRLPSNKEVSITANSESVSIPVKLGRKPVNIEIICEEDNHNLVEDSLTTVKILFRNNDIYSELNNKSLNKPINLFSYGKRKIKYDILVSHPYYYQKIPKEKGYFIKGLTLHIPMKLAKISFSVKFKKDGKFIKPKLPIDIKLKFEKEEFFKQFRIKPQFEYSKKEGYDYPITVNLKRKDSKIWKITEGDIINESSLNENGEHDIIIKRKTHKVPFKLTIISNDIPQNKIPIKVYLENDNIFDKKVAINDSISKTIEWPKEPSPLDEKIKIKLEKPKGFNVKGDDWRKHTYDDQISWNSKKHVKIPLEKLKDVPVLYADITIGPINRRVLYDSLNIIVKQVNKSDVKQCFLLVSNGIERNFSGITGIKKVLSDIPKFEPLSPNFYPEITRLLTKFQAAFSKQDRDRTNVKFYFYISNSTYDWLSRDTNKLNKKLNDLGISHDQVIFFISDPELPTGKLGDYNMVNWQI
jgi:hypothetical protein